MLPLLAIGLLAIIGVVGLAVDVGHAFLNKTRLQGSLDSAALSGARTLMLSGDADAASADARAAFGAHLGGEMAALGPADLQLQFSDTLDPFVPGGGEPRFVRAAVERWATDVFFAGVLQGVGRSMDIGGTAIAGPVPVGYPGAPETCDVAPLLVCGVAGDSDCADGRCFGYRVGAREERELRLLPSLDAVSGDEGEGDEGAATPELASALPSPEGPACGEGSRFHDCVNAPENAGEPGTFLVHTLDCGGEGCVIERLAGAFDACPAGATRVGVQELATPLPAIRGLMSRFGVAAPSLDPARYPPDVVTTDRTENVDYWHESYRRDVASALAGGAGGGGVAYRRVFAVPVVNCLDGVGAGSVGAPLGYLCLFLTRVVDVAAPAEAIYGQFVERCEASGEQGASVPPMAGGYGGPAEIVLYKDPDSGDS